MSDPLSRLGQAILAVRWGAVAVCFALASPDIADGQASPTVALGGLVLWSAARTVRTVHLGSTRQVQALVVVEAVIAAAAVVGTGYGTSPLVFALLVPAAIAGFAGGFGPGVLTAAAMLLAVAVPWVAFDEAGLSDLRAASDWGGEVLLVVFVAGYARFISGEADERRDAALDRLGRLSDANVLLFQLHQVTQALPATLDLTEVLDATVDQLRGLFDVDGIAIVLYEESDDGWHAVRRQRLQAASSYSAAALPVPVARTLAVRSTALEDDLAASGLGLDPESRSGLYGLLTARGATIGVVALEDRDPAHFTERDVELLSGFVDAAALAIDNARWFGRLRIVGADEERARIAKALHDRTGQSLAYLAFELDRLVKQSGQGQDVTEPLDALRGDVRRVVGELRDTLYDLRTDVSENDGMASTLASFLERIEERSGLTTKLVAQESSRLPLLREREMWRIVREALTNVERHARATTVTVCWTCDGRRAESLEVIDDGIGLADPAGGSPDGPDVATLRERAASIGATLAVAAEPGRGTRVRCTLAG